MTTRAGERRPSPATDAPLVVEFAGLPGAGKSTVVRRIVAAQRAQGREIRARCLQPGGRAAVARHHARFLAGLAAEPSRVGAVLRYGLAVRPPTWTSLRYALKLTAWTYRFVAAREGAPAMIVLDQGVVQQAWATLLGGTMRDEAALRSALRSVLAGAPVRLAYVFLDVDVELAVARIDQRPTATSRLDRMSPADARRTLRRHREELERIFACALEVTRAPHLRLDGGRPLDETCRAVAAFLDDALAGTAPPARPADPALPARWWRARTAGDSRERVGVPPTASTGEAFHPTET